MQTSGESGPRAPYRGGYFEGRVEGAVQSARRIVPIVMELVHPESVVDVGCGVGGWLSVFAGAGVRDYLGIDGTYAARAALRIPADHFVSRDLGLPLRLPRRFDLAVCLEVAEHLPESQAQSFVDDLVRLAPVVLFSAAVPFQGGVGHFNERWPEYWAERFSNRGYDIIDAIRPRIWEDPGVEVWYVQNTFLFVDRNRLPEFPSLSRERDRTRPGMLSVVHPRLFLRKYNFRALTLREMIEGAKSAFRGMRRSGDWAPGARTIERPPDSPESARPGGGSGRREGGDGRR